MSKKECKNRCGGNCKCSTNAISNIEDENVDADKFLDAIDKKIASEHGLDPHRFFLICCDFEEVNARIGPSQEEFNTLPAYFNKSDGSMTFKYQLTAEQLVQINKTGCVWFQQFCGNGNFQPVRASAQKSDLVSPVKPISLVVVFSTKRGPSVDFVIELLNGQPCEVLPVSKDILGIDLLELCGHGSKALVYDARYLTDGLTRVFQASLRIALDSGLKCIVQTDDLEMRNLGGLFVNLDEQIVNNL